jgi:hypothetical protein
VRGAKVAARFAIAAVAAMAILSYSGGSLASASAQASASPPPSRCDFQHSGSAAVTLGSSDLICAPAPCGKRAPDSAGTRGCSCATGGSTGEHAAALCACVQLDPKGVAKASADGSAGNCICRQVGSRGVFGHGGASSASGCPCQGGVHTETSTGVGRPTTCPCLEPRTGTGSSTATTCPCPEPRTGTGSTATTSCRCSTGVHANASIGSAQATRCPCDDEAEGTHPWVVSGSSSCPCTVQDAPTGVHGSTAEGSDSDCPCPGASADLDSTLCPPPILPEAPSPVMLPVAAALCAGVAGSGVWLVRRRRQPRAPIGAAGRRRNR